MKLSKPSDPLIPHLFRTEFSRITSVLCKNFGLEHIETAEDLACETFLSAIETWPYRGIPENPRAWLYAVAKNKARNLIEHGKVFKDKVVPYMKERIPQGTEIEIDLSEGNILDSQLQMLFAICHPSIPAESQIGLALRILCGFGIDEIAGAFLTNRETINKRLFRAREKLREESIPIAFPSEPELQTRLDNVLTTLYLLFSEGYYSESNNEVLREDLCFEAMRLTSLLMDFEPMNLPAVNALMALMCFHASRFPARKGRAGNMILYGEQDESLWDKALITRGAEYLKNASKGQQLTKYHLEANIAYWHTIKADKPEKWNNILQLYNRLLMMEYSPIAALNRTYALYKVNGRDAAIAEAEKLKLKNNRYYFVLLGELYQTKDVEKASVHFHNALKLATTDKDRDAIVEKIERIRLICNS